MDIPTVMSILALVISAASFGLSLYEKLREAARVKATSHFYPPQPTGDEQPPSPPVLVIRVANHGQRAKKLEYMRVTYANGNADLVTEMLWGSDEHGHYRIGENDVYEHTITPENDGILRDEEGSVAVGISFEDTLNDTYRVRDAGKAIAAYLTAAGEYPF